MREPNKLFDKYPELLDVLLIDRTKHTKRSRNHNIIWATDDYLAYGKAYAATAQIKPELIRGGMDFLIQPRALKNSKRQKERTKSKAEVFTPTWVVKAQNDKVDADYQQDDLATYVKRTWLEMTCGEAPYMATRYEMVTGELIDLNQRVGFVDRKLSRINKEVADKVDWQYWVEWAYKSSYGFEWSGDSLLIARENLLYTYIDYYEAKWGQAPSNTLLAKIADIISWNVFQMDGLKCIIPLSEIQEKISVSFDLLTGEEQFEMRVKKGRRVQIMDWEKETKVPFKSGGK